MYSLSFLITNSTKRLIIESLSFLILRIKIQHSFVLYLSLETLLELFFSDKSSLLSLISLEEYILKLLIIQ